LSSRRNSFNRIAWTLDEETIMNRRGFIKKSAVAAGLGGALTSKPAPGAPQQAPARSGARPAENRSSDYLRRARQNGLLPKPPVYRDVSGPDVRISPMPLAERVQRKIVPQRGFCSVSPATDALLISGNGAMSIDSACDPYTEQIAFRHESLFTPHKRPFEAPNIAAIFPKVRQMLLDGKYHDAARLGYDEWHKTAIAGGMRMGGGGGFSMRVEYPKTASVRNYLRTVDFESTELKVHWTDERGEWVRETFASRPDNVVVQRLTSGWRLEARVRTISSSG
jgi:alpha-L-fucosidase 2